MSSLAPPSAQELSADIAIDVRLHTPLFPRPWCKRDQRRMARGLTQAKCEPSSP